MAKGHWWGKQISLRAQEPAHTHTKVAQQDDGGGEEDNKIEDQEMAANTGSSGW